LLVPAVGAVSKRAAAPTAAVDEKSSIVMTAAKKRILVVGGGPAGAATAKSLADKGGLYDVQLLEAYPHPDKIAKTSAKAYVIALGRRGQEGIRKATGLDPLTIPNSIVSSNMARHPSMTVRKHEAAPSLIIPRAVLTSHLLGEAEKSGVKIL
jgi:2-polyprenyl-6-methoxyphenol hydroxylase-like FAD-dependent oxidoreductase